MKLKIARTHGMTNTTEYNIWREMKRRCFAPKNAAYPRYGGRGITVCKRWLKFENFFKDMGKRPSNKYSLDRKNNNGNYCLRNCKWSTKKEQQRNTPITTFLRINGIKKSVPEWCEIYGIKLCTYKGRKSKGLTTLQAITTPLIPRSKRRQLTFKPPIK